MKDIMDECVKQKEIHSKTLKKFEETLEENLDLEKQVLDLNKRIETLMED
jgi:hypothetical protein